MYIATGQGQTTPNDKILTSTETWSLRSFATSLKTISLKSDFIQVFFMILYMYIDPGQGQTAPRGQSLDVNRNVLSLHSFAASLKKMSFKSDFIQVFFFMI